MYYGICTYILDVLNGKCRWIYQSHGSNGMQISLTTVVLVLWHRDETHPKWREFQFLELDSHHDSVRKRSKVIRVRGKWIWLPTNMKTPVEVACLHQKLFINFDHSNNSAGFCLKKLMPHTLRLLTRPRTFATASHNVLDNQPILGW